MKKVNVLAIPLIVVFIAVFIVLMGWSAMLTVGILHAIYSWPSITISLWQGIQTTFAFFVFVIFFGGRNYMRENTK